MRSGWVCAAPKQPLDDDDALMHHLIVHLQIDKLAQSDTLLLSKLWQRC